MQLLATNPLPPTGSQTTPYALGRGKKSSPYLFHPFHHHLGRHSGMVRRLQPILRFAGRSGTEEGDVLRLNIPKGKDQIDTLGELRHSVVHELRLAASEAGRLRENLQPHVVVACSNEVQVGRVLRWWGSPGIG